MFTAVFSKLSQLLKHQNVLLFNAEQYKKSISYAITYKIVGTTIV
jgi:hypothetical protein